MSVEAADRVASASSGRPSTPPQISWFEFLLDSSLLEKHLKNLGPGQYPPGMEPSVWVSCRDGACPPIDPTPVQLIVQFLEQASKPSVNEQNLVQPPVDNRRNRTLKLLALKVAAHMKWDLDSLEKG